MKQSKPHSNTPPDEAAAAAEAAVPPADAPPAPAGDDAARAEAAALKERLLRLQADFDNFRKRSLRERSEWAQTAGESIVRDLLPVLDHFELGLKTAEERPTDPAVRDGFKLVHEQLMGVLKKAGLAAVDAHESAFDPHLHEAVAHVPSNEHAADEIVAQTRRGWKLGEKLLRPVQVVVSSGPGAPRDDEVNAEQPGETKAS